jgi:uncharacterized membrane protein YfcA
MDGSIDNFRKERTMNKAMRSIWETYAPTLVLISLITALGIWVFAFSAPMRTEIQPVRLANGMALVAIGFLAGVLGGLIGTGGCSVMLPAIHFWMGYPAPVAIGTTLFAVIFTAVSGGYGHLIRRNLDVKATLWLGISGIMGVILGSWLFTLLTAHVALLGLLLGIVFLWPAVRMVWESVTARKAPREEKSVIQGSGLAFAVFGAVIGVLTGVVGLGGGYALVPGLIYMFHAPVYVTMGTSLATMIPLAVAGGGIKLMQGFVDLGSGLLLAGGTVVGAQIGAAVIKKFRPTTLKLMFGVYFFYVSIKFITAYFGINIW